METDLEKIDPIAVARWIAAVTSLACMIAAFIGPEDHMVVWILSAIWVVVFSKI